VNAVTRRDDSRSSAVKPRSTATRRIRCCARAASGHPTPPPRSVMNLRRRIRSPYPRG
jgi:hypothetical protein